MAGFLFLSIYGKITSRYTNYYGVFVWGSLIVLPKLIVQNKIVMILILTVIRMGIKRRMMPVKSFFLFILLFVC